MNQNRPNIVSETPATAEAFDFESSRRNFLAGAAVIGAAVLSSQLPRTVGAQATPEGGATPPSATPVDPGSAVPANGTENQQRGQGGELRLLQWQAVSTLLKYNSTGIKDTLAGQLVLEPLYRVVADGSLAPILAEGVPSKDAGTLADDLAWVTISLKPGVLWSDGTPFTASDVKFTWEWNLNPDNGSFAFNTFDTISEIEVIDDVTFTATFRDTNPIWFESFSGSGEAVILPRHILEGQGPEANDAFGQYPVGTGPYVVETFASNDQVTYAPNENYREPNKPYFSKVILKGGGDAASAARAVLQTGDYDFAWNLQVEPEVLQGLVSDDGPGVIEVTPVTTLEEIDINHSDPRTEVNGEVSQKDTPHPILGDLRVRQALTYAINREQIPRRSTCPGTPRPPTW